MAGYGHRTAPRRPPSRRTVSGTRQRGGVRKRRVGRGSAMVRRFQVFRRGVRGSVAPGRSAALRPAVLLACLVTALSTAAVPAAGKPDDPPATGDGCRGTVVEVLAVASGTGHLFDLTYCPGTKAFGPPHEIDVGDWRRYREITATAVPVGRLAVYATKSGTLWWWRRATADGPLGPRAGV